MRKIGKRFYYDIILILLLLIVALSVFLIIRLTQKAGEYAAVSVGGEEVARYPLDKDGEYSINGGTNVLVISGGKAYMKSADCPDHRCVKMGKKSRSGERIICLPNEVEIRIVGGDGEIIGD